MAIAVLVSSPAEAEQFTAIGLDLASRLEKPLAVLCLKPAANGEKKRESDSGSEKGKPKSETDSPVVNEASTTGFVVGSSYVDTTRAQVAKNIGTMMYGFVLNEVIDVPANIDDLRRWLVETHQSPNLGHFEIDTLLIPVLRGAGVEQARVPKDRLFEVAQCETIYISVDQTFRGRLPLNNIGVCGAGHSDILKASRFARSLSNVRVTRLNEEQRAPDQECIVLAIPGKANQTRIDNNSQWNTMRKDATLPVAMVVNPADTRRERFTSAVDERLARWFHDYQMTREKRIELSGKLEAGAESSPEFILFMGVATFLACIGLIQDSAAVIIGAMLVAPLMTPLLGAGLAMIYGNKPLFGKALGTILLGVAISFCLGTLVGLISLALPDYLFSGSGLVVTNEMIARSQPNLLDPFIGLAAGLAGGFAIGRDGQIGTVAGVAIAAALVPPIATAGLEAAIAIYCAYLSGDPLTLFNLVVQRDPGTVLETHGLIAEGYRSTTNVHMVIAPFLLFVLNACTTIIGAFAGLRMVGMHRTQRPKQSRDWVPFVFMVLLLAVVFLLMLLPFVTS